MLIPCLCASFVFFFFSSRRRHTRFDCDWSSDVCSSDLEAAAAWTACGAFEWVALGYLAASSALIAVFAENLAHPVMLFGVQALVAAMILVFCLVQARVAERAERRGDTFSAKFWHFWRHWYPH